MPLDGVRVLDLSHALAGPFCSTMLADFGADVIKLEPRGAGDISRAWGAPLPRSEEHTSELQSRRDLVCRLLLEKKKKKSRAPRPGGPTAPRHARCTRAPPHAL